MTNWMTGIESYFALHVALAYMAIFIVSAGEALFVIGLFFPSTVVLVAAGSLVGAGKLHFLPVFLLTSCGAIVGDQLSYWFGHHYRDRVKQMWPLTNYVAAIEKGQEFFAHHGGASVFLGRFVPGVKAVVPGIAGMMGMRTSHFVAINVVSAFAWAALHLLPGIAAVKGFQSIAHDGVIAVAALIAIIALGVLASRSLK